MADTEWIMEAKKALAFTIVAPSEGKLKPIAGFRPTHTYAIFGETDEILGYKDLDINVTFNASDMRPYFRYKYGAKFPGTENMEPLDIEETMRGFLPPVAFEKRKDFETSVVNLRKDWTPPGKKIATFTKKNKRTKKDVEYEIWKGTLADPAMKQLLKRIQIFVPSFIEGGSYIPIDEPGSEADEERWTVFLLYSKRRAGHQDGGFTYCFTGYCTVYRFFLLQEQTPPPSRSDTELVKKLEESVAAANFDIAELPCRSRISQFIILPPYQNNGLGPELYNTIFQELLHHAPTIEITVEDPNEAFDDLRDVCDLRFLRTLPEFNALHIDTSIQVDMDAAAPQDVVNRQQAEAVRRKAKIAPRQFARLVEMQTMSHLADSVRPGFIPAVANERKMPTKEDQHMYYLWELMLKQRLTRHNKDALGELEIPERIAKLNETVASVAFDYARLLIKAEDTYVEDQFGAPEAGAASREATEAVENGTPSSANGKRKAGDEKDLDEADSKKQKV
ncbi:acyl-CoA N-acyltransferase [Echria macrotheca]|uniref:Histone acetyltransferase type B catalytic subunit n=1 Tax=Echria macrotheca TaxID=438768 RepID=A0AAJ0BG09_9PEZI|nr:acyl-CoA N-acyltransferase [Echria macrotheca]